MAFTTHSRTGSTDRTSISTPEQKTAPSAACHGSPMVPTTTAAKYAFNPIPGASAMGKFA